MSTCCITSLLKHNALDIVHYGVIRHFHFNPESARVSSNVVLNTGWPINCRVRVWGQSWSLKRKAHVFICKVVLWLLPGFLSLRLDPVHEVPIVAEQFLGGAVEVRGNHWKVFGGLRAPIVLITHDGSNLIGFLDFESTNELNHGWLNYLTWRNDVVYAVELGCLGRNRCPREAGLSEVGVRTRCPVVTLKHVCRHENKK